MIEIGSLILLKRSELIPNHLSVDAFTINKPSPTKYRDWSFKRFSETGISEKVKAKNKRSTK